MSPYAQDDTDDPRWVEPNGGDDECDRCADPRGFWRERGRVLCDRCELEADRPRPVVLELEAAE